MEKFECQHNPKSKNLVFSCQVSGNYELVLCEDCSNKEDRKFLLKEFSILEGED